MTIAAGGLAGHVRPDGSAMTSDKYAALYADLARAMKAVDLAAEISADQNVKLTNPTIRHAESAGPTFLRARNLWYLLRSNQPVTGSVYLDRMGLMVR